MRTNGSSCLTLFPPAEFAKSIFEKVHRIAALMDEIKNLLKDKP
jgi:hypothetical protein